MPEITHGLTTRNYDKNGRRIHHPLWNTWRGMKERCYNPKSINYHDYGARGITIYKEWLEDSNKFVEWAFNNGWQKGLAIDREEGDKGYSPDNCRFITQADNNRNQRKRKDNKSGYRGVCWDKKESKWIARVNFNKVAKRVGAFESALEAAKARDEYVVDNGFNLPLNFNHNKS